MENNSFDRDEVLMAVRKAVEEAGGKRITLDQFLMGSGLPRKEVFRHFARWEEVLEAAGYKFRRHNTTISTPTLLEDWGRVARELQRIPTRADYGVKGEHSTRTLTVRFQGWSNIAAAFLEFAGDGSKWADIRAIIGSQKEEEEGTNLERRKAGTELQAEKQPARQARGGLLRQTQCNHRRRWISRKERKQRSMDLPVFGTRLNSTVMQHAPMNENGVIYLFGAMAEKLGFFVESMQPGFPDCEAKRRVGADLWERVRIEFEYESRNFKLHGHPAEGCDLIVCWAHNWPECPVEVIALKDEMERCAPVAA